MICPFCNSRPPIPYGPICDACGGCGVINCCEGAHDEPDGVGGIINDPVDDGDRVVPVTAPGRVVGEQRPDGTYPVTLKGN